MEQCSDKRNLFLKERKGMEWLNRFTDVMDCLSSGSNIGMGVSELARETNLSKGTSRLR